MTRKIPVLVVCVIICIAAAAICVAGSLVLLNLHSPSSTTETPVPTVQQTAAVTPSPDLIGNPTPVITDTAVPVSTDQPSVELTPSAVPTENQPAEVPTTVIVPTLIPTPEFTISPTPVSTILPTATPTPVPTLTPLQKEGLNLIVGNWHGKQNIMGFATGTFDAVCREDFTADLNGEISVLGQNNTLNLPMTWEYIGPAYGTNNFIATTGDGTKMKFTCDGKKMIIPINTKIIDNSIPERIIDITLSKV